MKLQKYVLRAYYKTDTGIDVEVIPIHEVSKEIVKKKINENVNTHEKFTLYNFDWDSSDILAYGFDILTVSEFWGDS